MDVDKVRSALADRRLNVVADRTGIKVRTLEKIHFGRTKKPHAATLKVLSDYLGITDAT